MCFFFEKKPRIAGKLKFCGPKKTMQTQSQSAFRGVAAGIEPCRWISFFFGACELAWMSRGTEVRMDQWLESVGYDLLVNGVFLGVYNPLILNIDPNFLRQPSGGTP